MQRQEKLYSIFNATLLLLLLSELISLTPNVECPCSHPKAYSPYYTQSFCLKYFFQLIPLALNPIDYQVFLLIVEISPFSHEKPTSYCYFVKINLSFFLVCDTSSLTFNYMTMAYSPILPCLQS